MTRKRRRGFTLIELLVVMGIILLLMGLGVLSYQKLDKVAGENSTRTRLQTCASIEAEYEISGLTNLIEGDQSGITTPTPGAVLTADSPVYAVNQALNGDNSAPKYIPGNPGNVNVSAPNRYSTPSLQGVTATSKGIYKQNRAVLNTSAIMQIYSQMPGAQSFIAQLPPSALLPADADGALAYTDPTTMVTLPSLGPIKTPLGGVVGGIGSMVILDAWKNPIIYVPSGGLTGVVMGGARPPDGSYTATVVTGVPYGHFVTVRSVDGRPFWASAGQDGDFSRGDDNLYSCAVTYINQ